MALSSEEVARLRRVITENLRVQRAGAEPVPYIDVYNALSDIAARQNHAVFARRGCGKTLLLHHSTSFIKVVSHSRYVIFQMAEVAVPRTLFREILDRIRQLRSLTIPARPG